jgi:hypothetical protein
MFAPESRYDGVPERIHAFSDGRRVAYKVLRVIPSPPPSLGFHGVVDGDRLDLLAGRYLGDAEQFWRICDANLALRPNDLLAESGRRLSIPSDVL